MREQLRDRLTELRRDLETGKGRLRELERQHALLADQLLRIGGAIQVLEELLTQPGGDNGEGLAAAGTRPTAEAP